MTAPAETWRVECADGTTHEVIVVDRDAAQPLRRYAVGYRAHGGVSQTSGGTQRGALVSLAEMLDWPVSAILAPGELPRAAAIAAARRDGMHRGLALAQEHAAAVADGDDGAPAIDWTDAIAALGDALAGGAS